MGSEPEHLARIAQVDALAQGLALIMVSGPEYRARAGLEQIWRCIGSEREAIWHRFDRQGPDIAATLARARSERPVVLVHGLERMAPEARQDVEARLNLLRDTLAGARATIVLWIPGPEMVAFQRQCPDFWHWRSLLVEVTENDVPMEPDVEETIKYLQAVLVRQNEAEPAPDHVIEPDVRDADGARLPLLTWARKVKRGLLCGPAGSGKSTALGMVLHHAARRAWDALDAGQAAPIPVFVTGAAYSVFLSFDKPATAAQTAALLTLADDHLDNTLALIQGWAASGQLLVLLDELDLLSGAEQQACVDWLTALCREAPDTRVIATSRDPMENQLAGFERGWLVPWSQEQIADYMRRRLPEHAERVVSARPKPRDTRLQGLLESPRAIAFLANYMEERGTWPAVWMDFMEFLLGSAGWLMYQRGRSIVALDDWRRALTYLALELMAREALGMEELLPVLERAFDGRGVSEDELAHFLGTGFLAEQSDGRFRFANQWFQESLVAYALVDKGPQRTAEWLGEHLDDPAWREVAIMTWAWFVRVHGEPSLIWQNLWPPATGSELTTGRRMARMSMALEAAGEAKLDAEQIATYRDQAVALAESAEAADFPAEREDLREALAWVCASAEP